MAIEVYWLHNAPDILIFKFNEAFTVDDLRVGDEISKDLTVTVDHPFHLIYDLSNVSDVSRLPSGLFDYLKEDRTRSPHLTEIVVIMPKMGAMLARSVVNIGKALRRKYVDSIHIVDNQDDALALLQTLAQESKEA